MIDLSHEALLFGAGAILLMVSWLPLALKRLPLSLPIVCLALGFALSYTPWLRFDVDRLGHDATFEQVNEAVVLVALMGAGLRLDRPFGWARWGSTWRLLLVVMPLTMVAVYAGAHWGLGLAMPAAVLLAGALAPTDPVLAADVQTGPPGKGEDGETRFGLTSEAGLNDGLAFPFILLAIAMQAGTHDWAHWIGIEFLGELVAGIAFGWAVGWAAGYVLFRLPAFKLSDTGDGLVAIGITLVTFAATSWLHGNGFVAVFVAALTVRSTCPEDRFHRAMSAFAGQIERPLLMVVLVMFGWAIGGGLLAPLTWGGALLGLTLVLVVRPAAAWLSFRGADVPGPSKHLMGFFGIRGIGTLFYLQYAFNRAAFPERPVIWAICAFIILVSILLHGVTATPLMMQADERRKRREGKEKRAKDGQRDEAVAEAGCA